MGGWRRFPLLLLVAVAPMIPWTSWAKPQLVYPDFYLNLPAPDRCDDDQNFCGGDEAKYPKNEINEIVEKTMELKRSPETFDRFFGQYFNATTVSAAEVEPTATGRASAATTTATVVPEDVGGGRDLLELKPSCTSRTETIPRFSRAKNVLGKWMYLIDGSTGRQQNVEVTICENPDHVCDNDLDSPYGRGTTVCKQLYRTHKLLAIDNGGEVVVDTFELPSGCVCNYKSSFDLGFRHGDDTFDPYRDVQCSVSEVTEPIASRLTNLVEPIAASEAGLNDDDAEDDDADEDEEDNEEEELAASTTTSKPGNPQTVIFEPEPCGTGTDDSFFRICEDPADKGIYPESQIGKLLRHHPTFQSPEHFKKLFGKPCEFAESLTKFRIGFELTESPLCTSIESYIFPKVAKNTEGVWRYIVNTREYKQGVTIETCHRKAVGASCLYGGREGLKPEATVCKQLYSRHNLLTLTERGLLEYETFLIPSTCSCHLTESPYTPLFPVE